MYNKQSNNYEVKVLEGVYTPRYWTNSVNNIQETSLNEVTHALTKPISALSWAELENRYKMKGSNHIY